MDVRVVADVVRLDKAGEGLEPHVTEEIIKLMLSAPGGNIQRERCKKVDVISILLQRSR